MNKIKKLLLVHMPGSACNLRCDYCYITNQHLWDSGENKLAQPTDKIIEALSPERAGGTCLIIFCARGETLIFKESIILIRGFLEAGHYVEVVTNGTLTKRFKEIMLFPEQLRKKLTFKFSFHYAELKRLNLINTFFDNVRIVHNVGCSFTVEMTPDDKIEPYKSDILKICQENLGAPCQLTIARDDMKDGIPVMSCRSLEDYCSFWSEFHSSMLEFKKSIFSVKRKEFCYAGLYSMNVNLSTGNYYKCYGSPVYGNIFENMDQPIRFEAIGYCPVAHCYNGHVMLTTGLVPALETPTYAHIRNMHLGDGTDSLKEDYINLFSQKITDNNVLLTSEEEKEIYLKSKKSAQKLEFVKNIKTRLRKVKHIIGNKESQ